MAFLDLGDSRVHYAQSGAAHAPVVIFSNSLGTNFSMWDPQLPTLEETFRVLRYDTRGHGETSVTPGPYTIELLARDVIRLLDALHLDRVHFCGLSMGGMIGMWLGINAPERLSKLVLCNTAARIGTAESWNARIEMVRKSGMKTVAAAVAERWFSPDFRARSPQSVAKAQSMLENSPPDGYSACCAAIRDMDQRAAISAIRVPTLVITGANDPVTPPADGHFLAEQIPNARYAELDTAHLSNVEASAEFTSELMRFLAA
ncbi:MAG: 3-oxoadipate enol-lactonase [Candidatus Acidiferrales bacterium]